ncbi:MAG: 4Fe-4S cluster-binding domain-containing protein [Synergistaceae bacterium]|nr:4Fe-4S cluster-binding domain-containing protein [Synergistaceae bacterium]
MKQFFKSILPVPVWKFLRYFLTLIGINHISFETHVAEHCNLNCCGCDHFSPLADPEFVDIEEFRRDMERMGKLFSHKCGIIRLLGGEPLLNPEITTLMKIVRDNFTQGDIYIITNGALLAQQDKSFWTACKDNNVQIKISYYPISLDWEKIRAIANEFGVNCQYGTGSKALFSKRPLDLSGNGDVHKNFVSCIRNGCTTLKHGKLYICSFIPHVDIFNRKFHQNIQVTEDDYIDIYQKNISAGKILWKLAHAAPACRYCDIASTRNDVSWHVSERKISEWV